MWDAILFSHEQQPGAYDLHGRCALRAAELGRRRAFLGGQRATWVGLAAGHRAFLPALGATERSSSVYIRQRRKPSP